MPGHGRHGSIEALRRAREAAGLDDFDECGDRQESVHCSLLLHILQ
jgi:hypothetical protein